MKPPLSLRVLLFPALLLVLSGVLFLFTYRFAREAVFSSRGSLQTPTDSLARFTWQFGLALLGGVTLCVGAFLLSSRQYARRAGSMFEESTRLMAVAQRRFIADAAHELRTPLTTLRGEIEVALRRERGPAEYRTVLQSSLEEVERLSHLAHNLLTLAESDSGQQTARREARDLRSICGEVTGRLANLIEKKNITVVFPDGEPVEVLGDGLALHRAISNLVENAVKYSPDNGIVNLDVVPLGDRIQIRVTDNGIGIPKEDLPYVFERFYRVDKARSRELGGSGLGLSIVKAVAQAHGGRVEVDSEPGRGSRFTLTLPAGRPNQK